MAYLTFLAGDLIESSSVASRDDNAYIYIYIYAWIKRARMFAVVAIHAVRRVNTRHVDPSSPLYRGGSRYHQLIHRNSPSTGPATASGYHRNTRSQSIVCAFAAIVLRYCPPRYRLSLLVALDSHYYHYPSALRSCLSLLSPHIAGYRTGSPLYNTLLDYNISLYLFLSFA